MAEEVDSAIVNNDTNDTVGLSGRDVATSEGLLLAYGSLLIMALIPIYWGARRSVHFHDNLKQRGESATEKITARDAAMFPLYASAGLFALYLFFRYLSKDYVNLLLSIYFFGLGVGALTRVTSILVELLLPSSLLSSLVSYCLLLQQQSHGGREEVFKLDFNVIDIGLCGIAVVIGIIYFITKHWILNNVFGVCFAFTAIELISLQSIPVGCILLLGLFFYDIFWVFGTDVMVTVAKSFEAPIKLVFPMDFLELGIYGTNFSLLGLGDIVLPGIFVALLCRYDARQHPDRSRVYFIVSFIAYIMGLVITILVMHNFKAAQPALLYLVPACLGLPLATALLKGEISDMWKFEDYPDVKPEQESTNRDKTD